VSGALDGSLNPPTTTGTPLALVGNCYLGHKCEVYDAELHAIEEGLNRTLKLESSSLEPRLDTPAVQCMTICVDNQAALQSLEQGNPENHEYAARCLDQIAKLEHRGWKVKGLWTPAHCGIPGNEAVDQLAKEGTALGTRCKAARVSKAWLRAQNRALTLTNWGKQLPDNPTMPIAPSLSISKEIASLTHMQSRAYLRMQANTTPIDCHPSEEPTQCKCGTGAESAEHYVLYCPRVAKARRDLLPQMAPKSPHQPKDPRYDPALVANMITFLRRTGLGFSNVVRPGNREEDEEDDDSSQGNLDPEQQIPDLDI
jgi:ribonuclease HI